MSRIVMKFGGTSVGSVDRIKNVSKIVKSEFDKGNQVVVVLSAMAGETDRLIDLTKDISENFNSEEYDVVISSGEQVSVGLLSAALNDIGVNSTSCLGWQIPIVTSDDHKSARIEGIRSELINNLLNDRDRTGLLKQKKIERYKDRVLNLVQNTLINNFWTNSKIDKLESMISKLQTSETAPYETAKSILKSNHE